jgi:hypothetical protein
MLIMLIIQTYQTLTLCHQTALLADELFNNREEVFASNMKMCASRVELFDDKVEEFAINNNMLASRVELFDGKM